MLKDRIYNKKEVVFIIPDYTIQARPQGRLTTQEDLDIHFVRTMHVYHRDEYKTMLNGSVFANGVETRGENVKGFSACGENTHLIMTEIIDELEGKWCNIINIYAKEVLTIARFNIGVFRRIVSPSDEQRIFQKAMFNNKQYFIDYKLGDGGEKVEIPPPLPPEPALQPQPKKAPHVEPPTTEPEETVEEVVTVPEEPDEPGIVTTHAEPEIKAEEEVVEPKEPKVEEPETTEPETTEPEDEPEVEPEEPSQPVKKKEITKEDIEKILETEIDTWSGKLEFLSDQYEKLFSKAYMSEEKLLSVGKDLSGNDEDVYGLTFQNLDDVSIEKNLDITFSVSLWKSKANKMYRKIMDIPNIFTMSASNKNAVYLKYNKNNYSGQIEGLDGLFDGGELVLYKIKTVDENNILFKAPFKDQVYGIVRKQTNTVTVDYIKDTKFIIDDLSYHSGEYDSNFRFIIAKKTTNTAKWEFQYKTIGTWEKIWQDMETEFNEDTGYLHAWVKPKSKINRVWWDKYGSGEHHDTVQRDPDSYSWMYKNLKQFSLSARISWSYDEEKKIIMVPIGKAPKNLGDTGAFWFLKVDFNLDEIDKDNITWYQKQKMKTLKETHIRAFPYPWANSSEGTNNNMEEIPKDDIEEKI